MATEAKGYVLDHPVSGEIRHSPQMARRPEYAGLTFEATPAPECEGVEVDNEDESSADVRQWLPSIRQGVATRVARLHENGEAVRGVRIRITQVSVHPVATTPAAMMKAGSQLLGYILAHCRPS